MTFLNALSISFHVFYYLVQYLSLLPSDGVYMKIRDADSFIDHIVKKGMSR